LPQQKEAQVEERRKEAQACQVLQVPHLGNLTSMCPTKQLVMPQVKPQAKPQVKPQEQNKINHEDDVNMRKKKKRTRRGGRARAMCSRMNQDAKQVRKIKEDKMEKVAHIKCHNCE